MNNVEVLVLNGSPGSGKSTLANAISEKLRASEASHAVIDVDELSRIYPETGFRTFQWRNLAAIWANYAALPDVKVILPVLIDAQADMDQLRDAAPATKFYVCELVAPEAVLKERVTTREPNEYWQAKLRGLVDGYIRRSPSEKFGDFQITTHGKSVDHTVDEILDHVKWAS